MKIVLGGAGDAPKPMRASEEMIDKIRRFADWAQSVAQEAARDGWAPEQRVCERFSEDLDSVTWAWERIKGRLSGIAEAQSSMQHAAKLLNRALLANFAGSVRKRDAGNIERVAATLGQLAQCIQSALALLPLSHDPDARAFFHPSIRRLDVESTERQRNKASGSILPVTGGENMSADATSPDGQPKDVPTAAMGDPPLPNVPVAPHSNVKEPVRPPPPSTPGAPPPTFDDEMNAWLEFVAAFQRVLTYRRTRPPLGHFSGFRDGTIKMARSVQMQAAMRLAIKSLYGSVDSELEASASDDHPADLFIEELRAYSRAVSSFEARAVRKKSEGKWPKRLCGVASTILGSAKDVVGEVPYAKPVISCLKEVADIFK